MGFYIRKSVRVGPFRFNLSKSGIGVSAGIPGLRIGMGPRGNYIHAGRGGLYYRATLPSSTPRRATGFVQQPASPPPPIRSTVGPQVEIESGAVGAMSDETSVALLQELSSKRSRWRLAPLLLGGGGGLLFANWSGMSPPGQIAATVLVLVVAFAAHQFDTVRKSTVLMYDLEADALSQFEQLVLAAISLGKAQRVWHVLSRAQILDGKYHAGAGRAIKRSATSVRIGSAPMVRCNVDVPIIAVGRQKLCFFPDRLLVFDRGSVGAVSYQDLIFERASTLFVEEEGVPSDSRVVDRTWQYVNKKGGPDRRFKNNRELPVCDYEAIHFRSATGLNELLHASLVGAGEPLARVLSVLASDAKNSRSSS